MEVGSVITTEDSILGILGPFRRVEEDSTTRIVDLEVEVDLEGTTIAVSMPTITEEVLGTRTMEINLGIMEEALE